jgi:hypothetical protein
LFLPFRFLYAFHNRDFRNAFQKTLSPYFVCCRKRRASTTSSLGFPPATPSGESQRASANIRKIINNKRIRSLANINEQQIINPTNVSSHEALNGNINDGENSISLKRDSCL